MTDSRLARSAGQAHNHLGTARMGAIGRLLAIPTTIPMSRSDRFNPTLLLSVAAELSGRSPAEVKDIAARLLQLQGCGEALDTRSTLNNDDTPLEICVTADGISRGVRLIADPGADARSVNVRLRSASRAIECVFGTSPMTRLSSRMLAYAVPSSLEAYPEAIYGILWLAISITGPGTAIYTKVGWSKGDKDWDLAIAVARALMTDSLEAERHISKLRLMALPLSVGLESNGLGQTRFKVYWRLQRPVLLDALGVAFFRDSSFANFLYHVVGSRNLATLGVVLSTSYSLATGQPVDAKVDICAHCIRLSPHEWLDTIQYLVTKHGLVPLGVDFVLESGRAELAFIGFGYDRSAEKRLNIYLKSSHRADCSRQLESSHDT